MTKTFRHPIILRALIFWVPVKRFRLTNWDSRYAEFLDDVLNDSHTCLDQNSAIPLNPLPSLHFPSPILWLHRVLQNLVISGVLASTGQEPAATGRGAALATAPGCSLLPSLGGDTEMETHRHCLLPVVKELSPPLQNLTFMCNKSLRTNTNFL